MPVVTLSGSVPSTMFNNVQSLDQLVPVEGVGCDLEGQARETLLPPHIFTLLRSPEAIVTTRFANSTIETPVSSAAEHLKAFENRAASRERHEMTDGQTEEPKKLDKLLSKLHLRKPSVDSAKASVPTYERDGITHYAHGQDNNDSKVDEWQGAKMRSQPTNSRR